EKGAEVDWLTTQIKGQAQLNDKTYPISAQLRMRKDSVIWLSVSTILGLEAARINLTPDSVKFINRLNSTYFIDDVKELTKRYNLQLSFYEIQNVLLGKHSFSNSNTFQLLPSEQDYILFADSDTANYTLRLNSEFLPLEINSLQQDSISLKLSYSNFVAVQEQWLPQNTDLQVLISNNSLNFTYSYSKILVNRPKKINFSIPSSYAPM
ncbi:MAG: DUF4292 domain-containing protein, partial [Bacteroidota bacterium]|nr:DUF4292 domain-containing protein [Bacteroidota bacterium]